MRLDNTTFTRQGSQVQTLLRPQVVSRSEEPIFSDTVRKLRVPERLVIRLQRAGEGWAASARTSGPGLQSAGSGTTPRTALAECIEGLWAGLEGVPQ